ncbi:MAG: hypothetical protein U0575_00825 [Phycisphaerales bacterium]
MVAVVTLGNCPNTDILVSNAAGTNFAHVQVKAFVPGNRTCTVGMKAERKFGPRFFWVLAGIQLAGSDAPNEYFVVPAEDMARAVSASFEHWATTPGKRGQLRNQANTVRTVQLPPRAEQGGWSLEQYRAQWSRIAAVLTT